MSKPFAKPFYNSKHWKQCRDSYIANRTNVDGGSCEGCRDAVGEELHHITELTISNISEAGITVDHNNLKWLCKDCHFKEHRRIIVEGFNKRKVHTMVNDAGYYFDDSGEMRQAKTYIVWGSPASGKTTYVRNNIMQGDLVVDLDLIKQSISMRDRSNVQSNLLPVAIGMRDYTYNMIENGSVDCKNKWVIASLPNKAERLALADRLGAELIHINSDYIECIKRVDSDEERKDKVFEKYLVDKWWEQYEA